VLGKASYSAALLSLYKEAINLVRKGYRNLSIPEQLFVELQQYVEKSKGRYVSVAEVVREAIREFLEKHKQT
jgi:Arc/MetJ-type ribon-helix-helix transcriptional regulator